MQPVDGKIFRVSPQSSDDLLETYRRSNAAEDFEQIVRRFAALVLCECRRVTGNVYDAEDASQMVFLALAMEIKSGSTIRQPGAWLKRVARRQALKVVRSRTRRRRREDAARRSEIHLVDADSPIDSTVIAGVIRDEIDQLPERYRLAVILHYFGGMTLELIAQELRITRPAVGTRLHRGRKMLAERLSRQGVRLNEAALTAALGVLVPATVVGAVLRAATRQPAPVVAAMPTAMRQVLQTIAVSTLQRPLRLAAVSAILAAGTSGLALVNDYKLPSIHQVMDVNPIEWIRRVLQKGTSFKFQISSGVKPAEKIVPRAMEAKAAVPAAQDRKDEVTQMDRGWTIHFDSGDAARSDNGSLAIDAAPSHLSASVSHTGMNHTGGIVQALREDVVASVVIHRENVAARVGSAKPQAEEIAGMMAPGGSGGSRRGVLDDVAVKETPKVLAPVTIEGSRGDEVAMVGTDVVANYDEATSNHYMSVGGYAVTNSASSGGTLTSEDVIYSSLGSSGGKGALVLAGVNPSAGGGGSVVIPAAIPEPGTIALLVGGSWLVGRRRRRTHRK